MPKAFDDCVANGGKVRTMTPEAGKYMHVCFPRGGGPSVAGEMKTTMMPGTSQTTAPKSKQKTKFLKKGK